MFNTSVVYNTSRQKQTTKGRSPKYNAYTLVEGNLIESIASNMAALGEAEQVVATTDSDQGDFNEAEAPGKSDDAPFFPSDSIEELIYDDLTEADHQTLHKGTIHSIVRQTSYDSRSETPNTVDQDTPDISAGEESLEDSAEVFRAACGRFLHLFASKD